jgi:hypothetical protein
MSEKAYYGITYKVPIGPGIAMHTPNSEHVIQNPSQLFSLCLEHATQIQQLGFSI